MQVLAGLGMDDQSRAACFDVPRRHHVGGAHHQMGLERQRDAISHGGDHVGPERQVGDELAVHHVPLHEVDAGLLEGDNLVAEAREVRREHRRGDLDRQRHGVDANAFPGHASLPAQLLDAPSTRSATQAGLAPRRSHWMGRFRIPCRRWQPCSCARTGSQPGGEAIARHDDGRVVFVRGALPGETVLAEIVHEKRDWARAHVVDIVEASTDRVVPPCASRLAGCGGCGWMHLDLDAQRRAKAAIVEEALRRTGGIADPVIVAGPGVDPEGYRTTARVAPGPGGAAGFPGGAVARGRRRSRLSRRPPDACAR